MTEVEVTQDDGNCGYVEAEQMLRDIIAPSLISGTAIRVARDHMMQFARHRNRSAGVVGKISEKTRAWIAQNIDAAKRAMKISAQQGNGYANFAAHDAHKALTEIREALSTTTAPETVGWDLEQRAMDWLDARCDPDHRNDRDYSPDDMIDAFMAGAALRAGGANG